MELPTLTISAANGWMKQENRFSGNIAGKEQKNYTLLHKGELSYNHGNSKLAKYGTVFSLQTYEEALVPRVYHSFKVEIGSADFIEYYFATKMPDRELRKLISSGARMDGLLNIGYDDFMGIKMMFPSVLEQDKIAEYFRAFDHLITLHQRKSFYNIANINVWEQRKLEAVLSLLKDGTHGTHQDAEEGPYLLSAKNIKNGQIIIDDSSDRKISEDEFNQIHTKFTLENGDILLTIVGSIGESAILESAGKFTFQRSVAFLRPSEEMTSRFLKTEIESVQFQKELNDRKSQSAQPGVYLGDLSKIPIYVTSKEEQKKIGKYFSHLDNLITLHRRAYHHIKRRTYKC